MKKVRKKNGLIFRENHALVYEKNKSLEKRRVEQSHTENAVIN